MIQDAKNHIIPSLAELLDEANDDEPNCVIGCYFGIVVVVLSLDIYTKNNKKKQQTVPHTLISNKYAI